MYVWNHHGGSAVFTVWHCSKQEHAFSSNKNMTPKSQNLVSWQIECVFKQFLLYWCSHWTKSLAAGRCSAWLNHVKLRLWGIPQNNYTLEKKRLGVSFKQKVAFRTTLSKRCVLCMPVEEVLFGHHGTATNQHMCVWENTHSTHGKFSTGGNLNMCFDAERWVNKWLRDFSSNPCVLPA